MCDMNLRMGKPRGISVIPCPEHIPDGREYDERGRCLSDNFTRKHPRFKDWFECGYDADGFLTFYRDETGFDGVQIAHDDRYTLLYDAKRNIIRAGCQYFTSKPAALWHWWRSDKRARIFRKAIWNLILKDIREWVENVRAD